MNKSFADELTIGGKSNSLGKVPEIIEAVVNDRSRLDELYDCLLNQDAWVRMRAIDALEKVCRQHPEWLLPFIDRFFADLASSAQPSIQWHLAQIYAQVELTDNQKRLVMKWLKCLLSNPEIDWIVSANAMDTLVKFTLEGSFPAMEMVSLLEIQKSHKSKAVTRRADKLRELLSTS